MVWFLVKEDYFGGNIKKQNKTNKHLLWGTWVAQSVNHLTRDFGSGHGLTLHGFEPHVGFCAGSEVPA